MTYSIVARCPDTHRLGVAVQSHFFSVGAVVPWLEAGVGAVATQAMAEVAHGPNGLEQMRSGQSASAALEAVLAPDALSETRQVAMVDAAGSAAVHTGSQCIREAGHVVGDGFTTQANMMQNPGVPEAMAAAFHASGGDLADRMLDALDAAEALGGDIRGQQSAALVVVFAEPGEKAGMHRAVDVRVEDHPAPLGELRRLVGVNRAYRRVEDAETAMAEGELGTARAIYEEATAQQPDNLELAFWQAIVLASAGDLGAAHELISPVFAGAEGERWRELLRRLPPTGMASDEIVSALL